MSLGRGGSGKSRSSSARRESFPAGRLVQSFTLTMPGPPVPWRRPGATRGRAQGRRNEDQHRDGLDAWAQLWMVSGRPRLPDDAGVCMDVLFLLRRPDYHYDRRGRLRPEYAEATPHNIVPDLSNLMKLVEDGLNGLAWPDDRRIVDAHPRKRFAPAQAGRLGPRTVLRAWTYGSALDDPSATLDARVAA